VTYLTSIDHFDVDPTDDRIVYAAGGELARELIPNGLAWRTPSAAPPHCYLCMHPCTEATCLHCRCRDHVVINSGDGAHELARERYRELRKKDGREANAKQRAQKKAQR
jgi:hypothetical protein